MFYIYTQQNILTSIYMADNKMKNNDYRIKNPEKIRRRKEITPEKIIGILIALMIVYKLVEMLCRNGKI